MKTSGKERMRAGSVKSGKIASDKARVIRAEYKKNPKICFNCKDPISWEKKENKFCSSSCFAKTNNPIRTRKRILKNPKYVCLNCNRAIQTRGNTKYCNNKCSSEHQHKKSVDKWKADPSYGQDEYALVKKFVRKYLLRIRGEKCEVCGWCERHPITDRVPLNIHHIDSHEDCSEENLQLLCPNCHSLTLNFGILNKGKGRKQRPGRQLRTESKT